ncbi:MAG: methyltransferase domain-containing protein [Streptosporangiales bacterium]|nr:methyltransferase domain-containing protein [Streptosporangiales bacterium]
MFARRIKSLAHDANGRQIRILEAGCGVGQVPNLDDVDSHITGIDYDHPVLRARTEERSDLDLWMLGDLRTLPLPQRSFDVVHSSWLLQRAGNVELVLDRILAALQPGGLFLLKIPDRESAYGFCVRILPMWVRTLYWRWLGPAGSENEPLPVVYELVVSHAGIQRYCLMRGLVVMEEYASAPSLKRFGRLARPMRWVLRAVEALSGGRLSADRSDLVFVIRKPENRFARLVPGPFDAGSYRHPA